MDQPYPLQVLLLEDNPDDAFLLEHALKREGFALHVNRADSRESFLDHLRPTLDLILSDYSMPGFNALEALEIVNRYRLDVPFIIISGTISEEIAVEAMRRGAADYLLKDRPERLGQAIRKVLHARRDRVEKEQAIEASRTSAALNQSVLASLTSHIAVVDAEGRIICVNEAWETYAAENGNPTLEGVGLGDNYLDVLQRAADEGDLYAREALRGIWTVLDNAQPLFTMEYPCDTPARPEWFEMKVTPLVEAAAGGAVIIHTNITERKLHHEALRESEERWRTLVETNPEAVFISADGRIEYCNAACAQLIGTRDPKSLIGRTLSEFVQEKDQPYLAQQLSKLYNGEATSRNEYTIRTLDGEERVIETFSVATNFQGRRLTQTVVRDLTERKRYERALIEAKERAEEMNRLKNTFLNNMSHEIRTPLTGIIGCAEVLAEREDAEDRDFALMIQKSGQRLMQTLNTVLELAMLESGKLLLRIEPRDLVQHAEQAVNQLAPLIEEAQLHLERVPSARPLFVAADADALNRVLQHLITNAIKFTRKGSITLTFEGDAETACIHIADTGVGISPDFMPHLFQEFRQESAGLGRNFEGSGLSLANSRRLVERMGGTIRVESEKGKGSTFTVVLPRAPEPGAWA